MTSLNIITPEEIDRVIDQVFTPERDFHSIEEAAQCLTQVMYAYFQTKEEPDFVLIRVFQSIEYPALPSDIQQFIIEKAGSIPPASAHFLTLLGTYGDEIAWQHRASSSGHQAIPLTNETLKTIPMVSRLFQQLGFALGGENEDKIIGQVPSLTKSDKMFYVDKTDDTALHITGVSGISGIFHVEKAEDSPYIPSQDFVKNYNVQSVIGSGALLPQNEMAAFIGFSRRSLTPLQAAAFAPIISKFWHKAFPLLRYGIFS